MCDSNHTTLSLTWPGAELSSAPEILTGHFTWNPHYFWKKWNIENENRIWWLTFMSLTVQRWYYGHNPNFNGGNRQNPSRDLSSQECTYYYADDRLRYMTCRPPKNSPSYSSPMIQRVRVDSSKMSSYTEARCRRPSCCKGELSGAPTLLKICWMRMRQVPMNFSGRQTKITKCDRTDGSKGNVFFAFVDKLDIIL